MIGIDQTNFNEMASDNQPLVAYKVSATLKEIVELLEKRYPEETIGDSIAIQILDQENEEIYYLDCNETDFDIDIETLYDKEVIKVCIDLDWYDVDTNLVDISNDDDDEDDYEEEELECGKLGYRITIRNEAVGYEL